MKYPFAVGIIETILYLQQMEGDKTMSTIVPVKVGKHIYLYESESYRDEQGRPRNNRKCVGKINPETCEWEFNKPKEEPTANETSNSLFTKDDIQNSTIKEYGLFYFLDKVTRQIGLTETLQKVFQQHWESILTFAFFIIDTGDPAMYCEEWLSDTESYNCGSMSSQRISEMLKSITLAKRMVFYEKWASLRAEQEYFALDITSVSSYSEFISDVEWGYNRDRENLPQINICMMLGEKSRLPVFQTVYSGSLKDVSTLKTTLKFTENLSFGNMSLVMDKGFCSTKNINAMLADPDGIRFLLAMPFTLNFAKEQVDIWRDYIDRVENVITVGNDIIRGATHEIIWNGEFPLYAHIYFNFYEAMKSRNKWYGYISKLFKEACKNPNNPEFTKDFAKYLLISGGADYKLHVEINNHAVEQKLNYTDWLVLISNHVASAEDAINIYRAKDVVEKGFNRLKNCLDFYRLRVHGDDSMQNKLFVGFIALVILSHIHKVMDDKNLYRDMTAKLMFKYLDKLRVQYIKDDRILFPLTKVHKSIFDAFLIDYPL